MMKKGLIALLALLMLAGCSRNDEPVAATKTEQPAEQAAAAEQTVGAEATEEELFLEELEWEGMKMKDYYRGGKDGILVRTEWEDSEGRHGVQTFWDNGMMATSISYELDGSVFEEECYSNGTAKISIIRNADGSLQENRYADDGIVEESDGMISFTPGTQTYGRTLDANGTLVWEMVRNEDGSRREWGLEEGGYTWEVHYSAEGYMAKTINDDPANGWHSETEFYDNGNRKRQEDTGADGHYRLYEFYANGKEKHSIAVEPDGTKQEQQYNPDGVLTYCYSKSLTDEVEFVGNDAGELIKYTENGTVYEGGRIPSNAKESFKNLQNSH